jgi:hypothetical protein
MPARNLHFIPDNDLSRRSALGRLAASGMAFARLERKRTSTAAAQATPPATRSAGDQPSHYTLSRPCIEFTYDAASITGQPQLWY